MTVTIFEALQNADFNIQRNGALGMPIAKEQLHNAIVLLEKGYSLDDEIEPLLEQLEQYGDIDSVPEKAA